jgi:hypothetical protein
MIDYLKVNSPVSMFLTNMEAPLAASLPLWSYTWGQPCSETNLAYYPTSPQRKTLLLPYILPAS